MAPLLNTDKDRFDTNSFGASMATTTIHQQNLDRRQEQKSSAGSVLAVSPGKQSNSYHHHYQVPTARSSSTKSVIKVPRRTSVHPIPSSNRLKDYRRSKNGMAGMPSRNNVMQPPTSILKNPKRSPRPASLAETIVCATAGLLSLRPSLAPNTPACKITTNTATSPGADPMAKTVTWSEPVSDSPSSSCSSSQSPSSLPGKENTSTTTFCSDWDTMFFNHVATPVEDRSTLPVDLHAGQVWLHQQRLLYAAFKNGQIHFADTFQDVQASSRLNLLEMMGMKM